MQVQKPIVTLIAVALLAAAGVGAQTALPPAQSAGGVSASGPKYSVVRSMAGTSGTESNGKLVIDDPQTTFHLGHDPKVIVYFEWKGPIGPHKFEGLWKNPEGRVVLVSDFQYAATTDQFAGYWTMLLSGSEATGIWTLEARIDGEAAGSFPFQLVTEPGAEAPKAAPPRQPMPAGDIYQHALAATVYVDKLDPKGKTTSRASGFFLDDGRFVTAFQNIDGASQVRIIFPDSHSQLTDQVLAWNRWQDWAILGVSAPKAPGVPRTPSKSWSVGSIAYYLEPSSGSSRVITSANVVGETDFPRAGDRLNISMSPSSTSIGSPLLDEFGDVIGMIGGSLAPGANLLESYTLMENPAAAGNIIRDGLAVPITLIPDAGMKTVAASLSDLTSKGQMLPLVSGADQVDYAQLTPAMAKTPGMITPRGERQQYSHADKIAYIYVVWSPKSKIKGLATMNLYDAENRAIGESKPVKVNLSAGSIASSTWQVPVEKMPVGIYRVDVALGDSVVWRRFFRVTE
jgi:S1-C subfamily serine protease